MKVIDMVKVCRDFDAQMKSLMENDREEVFKDITTDATKNPSRMPAFQAQVSQDIALRVNVALPSPFYQPICASLWYMDRDNECFPGIMMNCTSGDSIDEAVESLFKAWNRHSADELVRAVQELFWHVNRDKANRYAENTEIMAGTWYRLPLFVKKEIAIPADGGEEKEGER